MPPNTPRDPREIMESLLKEGYQILRLPVGSIHSLVGLLTRPLGQNLTYKHALALIGMFESMLEVEGQNGSFAPFPDMIHRLLASQVLGSPAAGFVVDKKVVSCRDIIVILESRYECMKRSRKEGRDVSTTSLNNSQRLDQAAYVQPNHPRYGQALGVGGVSHSVNPTQARTTFPVHHQLGGYGNTRASVPVERSMYPQQFVPDLSQLRPSNGPVSSPSSRSRLYEEGRSMPNSNSLPQASIDRLWQGYQRSPETVIPSSMGSLAHGVARADTAAQYHPHNHGGYASNAYGGFAAFHHSGQFTNEPQNGADPSGSGGGWM